LKKVTRQQLKEWRACSDGYTFWLENCEGIGNIEQVEKLMKNNPDWANWLIVRVMSRKQYIAYAIYAAEQVVDIYENRYPNDNRVRQSIETARKVLKRNTKKNRDAAMVAREASWAAARAARAVDCNAMASWAAGAASWASWAADCNSKAAVRAVDLAAVWAAREASWAAREADEEMMIKILNYGISLLKNEATS